jgi:hypothetical protein
MSRQVDILSTSSGEHYIEIGMNNSEIASFKLQMWITHYGRRAVDFVQSLSLSFISFMGGDVWIHNSTNVDRLNLFGEAKDCKIGIVANQNPNVIKLLDSIGIHSDGDWEVESVTIQPTVNYPNGQYSKIPLGKFKKREGVAQSAFLRNMKTSSDIALPIEAITGEPLRAESAYIVLKNSSTTETKLFKVDLRMTSSR